MGCSMVPSTRSRPCRAQEAPWRVHWHCMHVHLRGQDIVTDQTPYAYAHRCTDMKSRAKRQAKGWKWWLARTFAAAGRALAVDLQVGGRADTKAADGVAVAVAGASARHLDEVLPPAHPAHLPQLLLAEQPRAGNSVRRGHVSGQEQDKAQQVRWKQRPQIDLACVKARNNRMPRGGEHKLVDRSKRKLGK